jgi:hypothetical protein
MAKQTINIGSAPNAKNGDSIRDAFNKVNQNFNELYQSLLLIGSIDPSQTDIDGGSSATIFSDDSAVDGGAASTIFDENLTFNGGGA